MGRELTVRVEREEERAAEHELGLLGRMRRAGGEMEELVVELWRLPARQMRGRLLLSQTRPPAAAAPGHRLAGPGTG